MNLFLYLDRDTCVHRLDPRTKLVLMLGSFAVAVLFFAPIPLLLLLGVLLAYGTVGRALGNLRRIWPLLLSIAAVSIVSWSVFAGGSTSSSTRYGVPSSSSSPYSAAMFA